MGSQFQWQGAVMAHLDPFPIRDRQPVDSVGSSPESERASSFRNESPTTDGQRCADFAADWASLGANPRVLVRSGGWPTAASPQAEGKQRGESQAEA